MNHYCGTRLKVTHSCPLMQITWCETCKRSKIQPKRQPGGARVIYGGLFVRCVSAVYQANKDDGMRLREAIDIVEGAYIRHGRHCQEGRQWS